MTSRDFAEMIAANELEPWVANYREFLQAGIIAAAVHNSFQMFLQKGKRKYHRPEDYIPEWIESELPDEYFKEPDPQVEQDELWGKISATFFALGGVDLRGRKDN